jgi:serine/threonine-protein kinase HipA
MADELSVWLYGTNVATITQLRGRLRLTYTEDALNQYELGTPVLSVALPLTDVYFAQGLTRAFLDGLLPEGESRRAIAEDLDLRATDTYGLIRALGRDCAGAIVIQPSDDPPPPQPSTTTAEPLDDDGIAELVRNLRSAPLGVSDRVRISLAGVQEKLLLTRMADGRWGRPVDGTPSTHILKPKIRDYPNTVQNEAFCMRLASELGLPAATIETTQVAERSLIVVHRYDRIVGTDGSVERVHQEDFCQAVSMPPTKKYQEEGGGPSLRRLAEVLRNVAVPGSVERLLSAAVVNVLVGNGDAHAKNFSLLHHRDGQITLAPTYDVMSTLYYHQDELAMYVDDVRRTSHVTLDRLINEAVSWNIQRARAIEIADSLMDRLPAAVDAARDQTTDVPQEIVEIVRQQASRLRNAK